MPRQESQSGPARSATTGTPGKDLRAAESSAIGGAGSESPGDSEGSGSLRAEATGAARVRRHSLLGRSSVRDDTPSEEAGESRRESGKPWRGNKPMGVSIGLLAAMLQRNTDSSVEQRLEVEAPCTKGTAFRSGAGGARRQRQEGQEVRRRTSATDEGKTSEGVSPRSPGI